MCEALLTAALRSEFNAHESDGVYRWNVATALRRRATGNS
jgi:hypothetical protein